ncbi:DNA helicase [Sporobolomyces koalae]|uniref:DNA helicase n=1 Tax=Sporobolomyces koalae TaxID=500713 RepID=UPI00317E4B98
MAGPAEDGLMSPSDPTFGFPFEPYSIQLDLMKHLYDSISHGKCTVIESPTGTGKSLSLISSTLTFLRDQKSQARTALVAQVRASDSFRDEPDWVVEHEVKSKLAELERSELELEARLAEIRERERLEKERVKRDQTLDRAKSLARKRQKLSTEEKEANEAEQYAPTPYHEIDSVPELEHRPAEGNGEDNFSPAVRALLKSMGGGNRSNRPDQDEEPDTPKVYFASRTHSQLSQFVAELRKTRFSQSELPGTSATPSATSASNPTIEPASAPIRLIPLGSRQNLCINEDVRKRANGNNEALGDLCTDLQKGGTKDKRCPHLPLMSEPAKLNEFRDQALASVRDIEDIEDLGRKLDTCPYYGTRRSVKTAEVVTLPYNMLMQKTAREALGISLNNHVVVIDEAHNLIDSILSLHSVSITLSQITQLRQALLTYLQKFKSRFTGLNAVYLKQLALVLKGLSEFAEHWRKGIEEEGKRKEEMVQVGTLFANKTAGAAGALDQINLRKLDEYLQRSKIARKIGGYIDSLVDEKTAQGRQALRNQATRSLHQIQQFILSLANADRDGRILLSLSSSSASPAQDTESQTPIKSRTADVSFKYMLLAPSDSFRDIAEEAKSVVLAGGTMAPMSDFREQLFPYLPPERFSTFSCGHVVPPDHVATFAVAKGPTGVQFEFTYSRRKDEKLLDELGSAIVSIAAITPKGIVVFFPSYEFLYQVQARWAKNGTISRLTKKKTTFWEPKAAAEVDLVLREYSAHNEQGGSGAILFAVVGAKLSEGINFADDMARAVIVCGIPYPNAASAELKERMNYLKDMSSGNLPAGSPDAGQVLYQNLAFRAVNQSIGRAIRNSRDWASIILLDARYTQPSKKAQLPRWLGSNVQSPQTFGALVQGLVAFNKARRKSGG